MYESKTQVEPGRDGRGFRYKLKQLDIRNPIERHPFAAVGLAALAGGLVGLAVPKPRFRLTRALIGAAATIAINLVREAAIIQLGIWADSFGRQPEDEAEVH